MPQARLLQAGCVVDWTADAAYSAGDVIQLPDGRAGVVTGDCASGDLIGVAVSGIYEMAKTTSMVLLPGGKAFWDHSADKVHFRHGSDRDFYVGVVTEDATSAATTCKVNLNAVQSNTSSLADGFRSLMVLTAGTPRILPNGAAGVQMTMSATAEAQKLDALGILGVDPDSEWIAEFRFTVVDGGDNAALDVDIGVANGTHATDFDSVAEFCTIHLDGNSANISAQSDDGTTDVAIVDTTIDYTAGTPVEVWMDGRDPSDIQIYINGALVLGSSTFTLAAATGPIKPIVHMEKTSDDTPANLAVDWLHVRTRQ